jgi:hypothetical protein
MPRLLEPGWVPAPSQARQFWEYLHRWRVSLFHYWNREGCGDTQPADVARLVDHLLGTRLLLCYVGRWAEADNPELQGLCTSSSQSTSSGFWAGIQASFSCPLLRSVFDPVWVPVDSFVPAAIFASGWEKRIADALWLLFRDRPLPLSFFGDFHQLCVANPLGTDASRRYERGIHYTPAPIVDYLVSAILDRTFAGRSIDEIKRLRVLDPSCGCGAFLIAALRYVLRWLKDHAGKADDSAESWFQERFDVLSGMLFGIDIDERAVAWTIRLLLLAVWEASVVELQDGRQCAMAPPDLRTNIICRSFLDVEDDLPHGRVNAIIGGPPFVRLRELYRSQPEQMAAYRRRFQSARRGQFDLYMLFIEKALNVLVDGGCLGFSVSNSFIRTLGGNRIRRIIAQRSRVIEIVEFEDKEVYPEAITQIALLSLAKTADLDRSRHVLVRGVGNIRAKLNILSQADVGSVPDLVMHDMPSHAFDWPDWHLLPHQDAAWLAHIRFVGNPLEQFLTRIGQGLNTGADDVFLMREVGRAFKRAVFGRSRVDGKTYRLEGDVIRTIIRGRNVRGYQVPDSRDLCIWPYDSAGRVLSEDDLETNFPRAYQYLTHCRSRLAERPVKDGAPWYAPSRDVSDYSPCGPRLVSSKISSPAGFTLIDNPASVCHNSVVVIVPDASKMDAHCLLGILNSGVFWRFVCLTTPYMGCGRQVLRLSDVRRFPIPRPTTEEQRRLFEMIGNLAPQAMWGRSVVAVQEQINALANRLFEVED